MVTSEELNDIAVAIASGREWEEANVPRTDEHRAAWDRLADELDEMSAAGLDIDIPGEMPDIKDHPPK